MNKVPDILNDAFESAGFTHRWYYGNVRVGEFLRGVRFILWGAPELPPNERHCVYCDGDFDEGGLHCAYLCAKCDAFLDDFPEEETDDYQLGEQLILRAIERSTEYKQFIAILHDQINYSDAYAYWMKHRNYRMPWILRHITLLYRCPNCHENVESHSRGECELFCGRCDQLFRMQSLMTYPPGADGWCTY